MRLLTVLTDWRRVLIYTHRWLGIAGCLVFLMWFVSGVVMMYERMPRLTAEERLARLPALDASAIRIAPGDAARHAKVAPDRIRVGMLGSRPVYRLEADGEWTTVYADTGDPLAGLSPARAIEIVKRFVPEQSASISHGGRLEQPDQWTLDGGLPRFLPMHRVALGDDEGTFFYVSERTGEPVMKTTTRGRVWGFLGAVLHWTYFTPFRQQRELWRYTIIYAALIGCVMCASGLVVGIWRFSPFKRFRLKRQPSHSPYAGLMWWHHYAGLLFGLFSFTWALSGALSLTPWDWAPSTGPTPGQRAALSGGALNLAAVTPERLRAAVGAIAQDLAAPKEIEILQFQGHPFAVGYRSPSLPAALRSTNPDVAAIFSPQLALDRRLVPLDGPALPALEHFDRDLLLAAARAAMPGRHIIEATWLDAYDAYYYDKWNAKPLPILRVRYDDKEATALYVDPHTGLVSLRHTTASRINRWLYNGLHSFDFPFLYYSRPAWDVTLLVLSAGGLALTVTTMVPTWRRLRRHARHALARRRRSTSV